MERRRGLPSEAKFLTGILVVIAVLGALLVVHLVDPGLGWRQLRLWGPVFALAFTVVAYQILTRKYGAKRVAEQAEDAYRQRVRMRSFVARYVFPVAAALFVVIGIVRGDRDSVLLAGAAGVYLLGFAIWVVPRVVRVRRLRASGGLSTVADPAAPRVAAQLGQDCARPDRRRYNRPRRRRRNYGVFHNP